MKLNLSSSQNTTLEITFYTDEILEAVTYADLGEGSPLNPINLDVFVENKLSGIPDIKAETNVELKLSHSDSLQAKIVYSEIQNLTKDYSGYMDEAAWRKHFDWDTGSDLVSVAPNGILFVKPDETGTCHIQTKKSNQDLIISYGAVVEFLCNNRICYGRIDPLAKVSSGGRD